MLRGGAHSGSYHMHQMGSVSERPLDPKTSSFQARTMPSLMTTRCTPETSGQVSSGTSGSPFTFIPRDAFLSPTFDSKPDTRQQAPAATIAVNTFFPSSSRPEILLEDPSLSTNTHAQPVAQQMLNRGASLQSAGADTNNTQSSGTSGGSSQLSNGGRGGTGGPEKDECVYNQLHTITSATINHDQNEVQGADLPSNGTAEEWGGDEQVSVIITEQVSVIQHKDGRNEKIRPEAGSPESESAHQHQLGRAKNVLSDFRISEEVQHSKLNNQQHPSDHDHIVDSAAAEPVQAYPSETVAQSNVAEIFPAYNTNLISSDSYNFPTGAELLGVTSQLQHSCSHPSRGGSVPNGVPDDSGGPFRNVGELYPSQDLVGRLGYNTVTASLRGTWTNMASHQYASSSMQLDGNHVHHQLQEMPPIVEGPVSSLLADNLQDNPYSHGEPSNRDESSYFSPQQAQTDAMELCLNPTLMATADSESSGSPPANLVLMSHSGLSRNHNQQHFLSIPVLPVALAQGGLQAQRSQLLPHQGIPSTLQGQHLFGNQGHNRWRNGGNELPLFLPVSDSTVHTQAFTGQMSDHLQQVELGISQYGSRRSPTLSSVNELHQHQHSIFQNGDSQSSPTGILQGLSLSLSSPQPSTQHLQLPNHPGRTPEADTDFFAIISQASVEAKGKRVQECTEGRYNGILSRFRPERDDHDLAMSTAGQRLNNYGQSVEGKHSMILNPSTDPYVNSSSNASHGPTNASKYLKLCQILLNEICVVRKCERRTINVDHLRPQSSNWGTDQTSAASASNTFASCHSSRDVMGADYSNRKDFMRNMTTLPGSSSSLIAESRGREALFQTHVQSESTEDLEKKKMRLGLYLEEVDRRYRAYGGQIMDIISQFNSIAGPEAATPYTALALQAMSRHFKCLRDAISAQLRPVKRALGEQDTSPGYSGRDLSSLRFVDQQLRQQRTLQQLGMLQQHAWRPQRGLPERAVSVLRSWLFEHFLHPYPKDSDKMFLAKQTGLTRSQVSNWFINARVRLWKPMVEEMYLEEFNNSDEGGSGERNASREHSRRENEAMDYEDTNLPSSFSNGHAEIGRAEEKQRISSVASGDGMYNPQSIMRSGHCSIQNGSTSNSLDFDADQRGGLLKKSRIDIHNPDLLGSPIVSTDIESVSPGLFHDPCRLDGNYCSSTSADQDYTQHQDILAAASGGRFATYLGGNFTGYPCAGFLSRGPAPTSGEVSLTLGLRHSDGLSLPGAVAPRQQYMMTHGHPSSQRPKDHFDSVVQDDVVRIMDNVHSELPLSHLNPSRDDQKQRNRLTSHLLYDFVAQG